MCLLVPRKTLGRTKNSGPVSVSTVKGGGRLARGRSAAWRSADWQPTAHKTSAGRYTVIPSHALQWCFEYVALHHALVRGRAHLLRVQKQASTHAVSMNACAIDITGICVHPGSEEIVFTRCKAAVLVGPTCTFLRGCERSCGQETALIHLCIQHQYMCA